MTLAEKIDKAKMQKKKQSRKATNESDIPSKVYVLSKAKIGIRKITQDRNLWKYKFMVKELMYRYHTHLKVLKCQQYSFQTRFS